MYTKPRLNEWGVKFTTSTGVPDSLPAVGLPPGLSVSINPESYSEGMFSWQGHLDR